ncbi:MAG: hypothetical protein V1856_01975 [Candidatus Liptonbacteria bacterium]
MVKTEDIKLEAFLWWETSMRSRPCQVSWVGETGFRVIQLDNFKETVEFILQDDGGVLGTQNRRREMRPCTQEEVQKYFVAQRERLEQEAKEAQQKADEFREKSEKYILHSVLELL